MKKQKIQYQKKTTNVIDENSKISDNKYIQDASDNAVSQVKEEVLPEQARNIAVNVVYGATALILFIVSKNSSFYSYITCECCCKFTNIKTI